MIGGSPHFTERIRAWIEQSSAALAGIDKALDGARYAVTSAHGQVVRTAVSTR